jgi:hypothetical protein
MYKIFRAFYASETPFDVAYGRATAQVSTTGMRRRFQVGSTFRYAYKGAL